MHPGGRCNEEWRNRLLKLKQNWGIDDPLTRLLCLDVHVDYGVG